MVEEGRCYVCNATGIQILKRTKTALRFYCKVCDEEWTLWDVRKFSSVEPKEELCGQRA